MLASPFRRIVPKQERLRTFPRTYMETSLAGVASLPRKYPAGVKFDGRSFAPQLRGEKGTPREWLFVQLGDNWHVRNDGWKLNEAGELFDLSNLPWEEKPVAKGAETEAAKSARAKLQAVLDELNPTAGKSGPDRKAAKKAKKKKGKD